MKSTFLLSTLTLLTLIGCQKTTSTKSSNTVNNSPVSGDYCSQHPMAYGCPQYCQQNPAVCNAGGTTGGTTTGSTNGGTTTPTSPYIPKDNNWQALYQDSTHTPSNFDCPAPTGTGYDLRRGTVTLAGDNTYYMPGGDTSYTSRTGAALTSPSDFSAFSNNTSSFLISPSEAKKFYATDAKLRVRFKIRPQPIPPKGETWCYNRETGRAQDTWGYTKLKFQVSAVALNADGSLKTSNGYPIFQATKTIEANTQTCSTAVDFSGVNQLAGNENGIVLVIHDVMSNQACWYNTANSACTAFAKLRRASCWQMDIEASVDGTKDI